MFQAQVVDVVPEGQLRHFLGGGVQFGGGDVQSGADVARLEVGVEIRLFFLHQRLQGAEVFLEHILPVQFFFFFFQPLGQLVVVEGGVENGLWNWL